MTKQAQPRARIGDTPVWCAHDKIILTAEAKPNPRNNNTHPANQIELLGRIILNNGWRAPITISARSGFITKGHGRLYAAQDAGMDSVPVEYQEYEDEAAEFADLLADNQIAKYAEFDDMLTRDIVVELDEIGFDLELTGLGVIELSNILDPNGEETDPEAEWEGMPEFEHEDKTAFQSIHIHFKDAEAVSDFAGLIDQKITPKTRSLWFPEAEIETYADKAYTDEP